MAKHSHQKGHTTALVVCWPTFHRNVTLCACFLHLITIGYMRYIQAPSSCVEFAQAEE